MYRFKSQRILAATMVVVLTCACVALIGWLLADGLLGRQADSVSWLKYVGSAVAVSWVGVNLWYNEMVRSARVMYAGPDCPQPPLLGLLLSRLSRAAAATVLIVPVFVCGALLWTLARSSAAVSVGHALREIIAAHGWWLVFMVFCATSGWHLPRLWDDVNREDDRLNAG